MILCSSDRHIEQAAFLSFCPEIIHIDALPAEIGERYIVSVSVLGDIRTSLRAIAMRAAPQVASPFKAVRKAIVAHRAELSEDTAFPIKPQKIVWDLREALAPDDIADDTVTIIDCPMDYAENMLLTARLMDMKSPI
jgi:thiamine pyrophosphate-dependent acetolactate synthase large subunit-like protein